MKPERLLNDLVAVFPQIERVVQRVFVADEVPVVLKGECDPPYIDLGYGLDVTIGADSGAFVLSQSIPLRNYPHEPDDVDVVEVGQFESWYECATRACEVIAACRAQAIMQNMAEQAAAEEVRQDFDQFFARLEGAHG